MATTPRYIYGMHDPGGEHLFADRKGWITFTEEVGHDPNDRTGRDYRPWDDAGYGVIVRINHGYGTNGTYPLPELYAEFAQRCAKFVAASPGCSRWIIGNEPNHPQEWPVRGDARQKIDAWRAADCFNQVAAAIHKLPGHSKDEVIAPAIAPWTVEAGDWIAYGAEMLSLLRGCGGIGLHAYTHGPSPMLITSDVKMNQPYHDRNFEFRAYQDTLRLTVPDAMRVLPVYMTEIAQNTVIDGRMVGWVDVNNGWIQAAYAEIDQWNRRVDTQKILCGCLYRWPDYRPGDVWGLVYRGALHADLRAAVARGYEVPVLAAPSHQTFIPIVSTPPPPNPEPPNKPLPPVEWDDRLTQRGVAVTPYSPQPGEWYWRITKGQYWEEKEHTFAVTVDELGVRKPGVVMRFWNGGTHDKRTEAKPNDRWMVDFPMFAHGRSYGLKALDGPSDSVFGMGLGSVEQPDWNIHVSYWFEFQWTQARAADVPPPVESAPVTTPIPRYKIGDALYTGGYVNLRRKPGYVQKPASDIIDVLEPGTVISLIDGPQIADGLVWWRTRAGGGGWIAENDPHGAVLLMDAPPPPNNHVVTLLHPIGDPSLRVLTQPFGVNEAYYKQFVYDGVPLMGHNGVDYGIPVGTPIRAVDNGTVLDIKDDPAGFGLHLLIRHEWGDSLYAHLSQINVAIGLTVSVGEAVALSGNSGLSTGPHLHFGIRLRGYDRKDGYGGYTDPLPFFVRTAQGTDILEIIGNAATEFGLDADLLGNLIFAESRFRVNAQSEKGATGLAQLMPATWAEWSPRVGAANIHNPTDNVRVGAAYLAWLLKQFNGNTLKAIYAYNWGIGNVLKIGTPPIATQIYAYSILHGTEFIKAYRNL